nr:MAG TPA: hypothetical protein [Caudoviricetes sp.]
MYQPILLNRLILILILHRLLLISNVLIQEGCEY